MKVSLSWLKTFVPIDMPVDELAGALTMVGLEVASIEDRYRYLQDVLVGRIVSIKDHPRADRLQVCDVDLGDQRLNIVCGAPNIETQALVPVALPGARLMGEQIIETGYIRGSLSEGMLCSEAELGLGADRSGIMLLETTLSTGTHLAEALQLSDPVLEIDLTPNRPDCLSLIGIAREVAAIQKRVLSPPPPSPADEIGDIHGIASVRVDDPLLCPRYAARVVKNIQVQPSPFWLQDRLMSVGLRPVNNIVDVTNFVMLELGQPLHAFDLDRLDQQRIVVRTARPGETLTTLDQKAHHLSADMLLICDGVKPIAIAGVMGGHNSEIVDSSRHVLIESAYFLPTSVRRTAKALGMNTDASHRFERGIDPQATLKALDRAAGLIADISGGQLIGGTIDVKTQLPDRPSIPLGTEETNRLLGTSLSLDQIADMLTSIEFEVTRKQHRLQIVPPTYRVDVKRSVDLIEEIARLRGYDRIPTTFPLIPSGIRRPADSRDKRDWIKTVLSGFGFTEAVNYSFMNQKSADRLKLGDADERRRWVAIMNPLKEDQTVMRTSLLPGLLGSLQYNLARQEHHIRLFEIGKIFFSRGAAHLPQEDEMLGVVWTGAAVRGSWHREKRLCDFYDIKGVAEGVFNALKIDAAEYTAADGEDCPYGKPGVIAQIRANDRCVGFVGEIHPDVLIQFQVRQPVTFLELNLNLLFAAMPDIQPIAAIPRYPAVTRDATLIIDRRLEANALLKAVRACGQPLLEDVFIFDVFEGRPVPENKKSISLRMVYRSPEKTLSDDNVNHIHKEITFRLLAAFDATFPE